jgi:hypothetical protein
MNTQSGRMTFAAGLIIAEFFAYCHFRERHPPSAI